MVGNPETFDGEMAFEDQQLDTVAEKLREHGIGDEAIDRMRQNLRQTGLVKYEGDGFTVTRNLSQGFDVEIHQPKN